MDANGQSPPRPSILVVEDDPTLRSLVNAVLSGEGFEVETASDGEAGWDRLEQRAFDLLVTDHEMPRLKGLELIARVKTRPWSMPAILMSGTIANDGSLAAAIAVADAFLPKPFSVGELTEAVRKHLSAP